MTSTGETVASASRRGRSEMFWKHRSAWLVAHHKSILWITAPVLVANLVLVLSPADDALRNAGNWIVASIVETVGWVLASFSAVTFSVTGLLTRTEPYSRSYGQHTPGMWRLSRAIPVAVAVALGAIAATVYGLVRLGSLTVGNTVTVTDIAQSTLAFFTILGAFVGSVFLYRRSRMSLADSRRADDQQYESRFVEAARLLGDDNAAVRVAGAIAMGTLARDWEEQRQRCVDVLCGYLRVPPKDWTWTRAEGRPPPKIVDRGENEVRNTICQELRKLLSDPDVVKDPAARRIDIDLHGSVFGDDANFSSATFTGHANFSDATFTGYANFNDATFTGHANFRGATFTGDASFSDATFIGDAWFYGATFTGHASFSGATFTGHASFSDATFIGDAWFYGATFTGHAYFLDATFTSEYDDEFQDGVQRGPLGPLRKGSSTPFPPGNVIDDDGNVLRDAEWIVEGDQPEDHGDIAEAQP